MIERIKKAAKRLNIKTKTHIIALTFCVCFFAIFSAFAITAETTYIINDQTGTTVVSSFSENAESALEIAGIALDTDDAYTATENDGSIEINITRTSTVTVNYDCFQETITTTAATVGEFIEKHGIPYTEDSTCHPSAETLISDGMIINVYQFTEEYATISKAIHYDTEYVEDETMYEGCKKVITEGVNGYRDIDVLRTFAYGNLISEEELVSGTTKQPVTEVIAVGTKPLPDNGVAYDAQTSTIITPSGERYVCKGAINMTATAYTTERQSNKITASGAVARVGIVAADRATLPQGTKVYITSPSGSWTYGYAVVGDTGVFGTTIDLFYNTHNECVNFGVRDAIVYILE